MDLKTSTLNLYGSETFIWEKKSHGIREYLGIWIQMVAKEISNQTHTAGRCGSAESLPGIWEALGSTPAPA